MIDIASTKIAAEQEIAALDDVVKSAMVGSAVFSPDAKDVDYLVLVKTPAPEYIDELCCNANRWELCADYDTSAGVWGSVRSGLVNLIITSDPDFYDRFVQAAEVCAALKLTNKYDRVLVHRIVRDKMNRHDAAIAAAMFNNDNFDAFA